MPRAGFGTVYLRGRTWWIQYSHRGQVSRESSKSSVRSDALRFLRRRLTEIGSGLARPRDAERLTFEEMAAMLEADYRLNERRSLARAALSLSHLREVFGTNVAAEIGSERISAYIARRSEEGAKPATIRRELSALRRMFTLAQEQGRLVNAPRFPRIEERNVRTGFFEAEHLAQVLEHLPEHLAPVAVFAYLTGWRRGEIVSLRWADVDFGAGTVRLEPGTTKNGEGRVFPFRSYPRLAELLEAQRQATRSFERESGSVVRHVFHRSGKPLSDFYGAWRAACRKAGLPGRLFHDFRRTAVRNLERAGVPRSVATKLTGHKTEAVYRRYAIVCEADLAAGVAKLAAVDAVGGFSAPAPALRAVSAGRSSTKLTQSEPDAPARLEGRRR